MTIGILADRPPHSPYGFAVAALQAALFRPLHRTAQPPETYSAWAELLDSAAIGCGLLDCDGRWLAANPTLSWWLTSDADARDYAGVEPAEGVRAISPQPLPFADLTESGARCGRLALSGPLSGDVEAWVAPLRCEPGRRQRFAAVAQLRQRPCLTAPPPAIAASAVREPLSRFFTDAPVGIAVVDRESRFLQANAALGALLGADPQALAGERLTDWLHPDDHNGVLATLDVSADHNEDRAAVEFALRRRRTERL